MPEDYDVRGAHEAALEEAAERRDQLAQAIALFSALLATLGAVISLLGGHTQTEAILAKNDAVLLKARASDQWAYYQAEDMKRHLVLLGQRLAPDKAVGFQADVDRYGERAKALRAAAEDLDGRSAKADAASLQALAPHGRLAVALTALQVAIALASVTALTRKRWLLAPAALLGLFALASSAFAWF